MSLKQTSQPLNIGASLDFADGGGTTALTVTLPLSSLDREVFVVTDIQMEHEPLPLPSAAGNTVTLNASVNKTGVTFQDISNPDTVGSMQAQIQSNAVDAVLHQMSRSPDESSTGTIRDYIGVIATPDFVLAGAFASTAGGQPNRKVAVRLTGYRAVATADVYAALVTEELNS